MKTTIDEPNVLDEATQEQVRALVRRAEEADGVAPLAEQGLFGLGRPAGEHRHVVVRGPDGAIVGYAGYDPATQNCEMVVDPAARRRGIGTSLIIRLRAVSGVPLKQDAHEDRPLTVVADHSQLGVPGGPRLWAHGDLAGAQGIAGRLGLIKARELWLLRRPFGAPLPEAKRPPGVEIVTFSPGIDDAEWIAANARIFAGHPEQGQWTQRDLAERIAAPWFDPSVFFLARIDGRLAGFVWLKICGDEGEIYVIGVQPEDRSLGLGRYLTSHALQEMERRGLREAKLYVEANNGRAVGIYRDAGFEAVTADGQYVYPA